MKRIGFAGGGLGAGAVFVPGAGPVLAAFIVTFLTRYEAITGMLAAKIQRFCGNKVVRVWFRRDRGAHSPLLLRGIFTGATAS